MQRVRVPAIGPQVPVPIEREAELRVLEAGISRVAAEAAVVAAAAPSEVDLVDLTEQALARQAAVALQVWGPEEAAVAVDGADKTIANARAAQENSMRSMSASRNLPRLACLMGVAAWLCLSTWISLSAQESSAVKNAPAAPATSTAKAFDTPQQAADMLVDAAEKFDEQGLIAIFGREGKDVVLSGEVPQDRARAAAFAAEAREKKSIALNPKNQNRAYVIVGNQNWPFPVPIVKTAGKWSFDAKAGRQELIYRRIGYNELDAIQVCRGYVEAQDEYAYRKREGYDVNQYAQRTISTPGKQDGLAWQNPDGTWAGPIGQKIAHAIEQGYDKDLAPYHGYYFKILKGQGPAAPLGQMDFVVQGAMIGGFALVAAPAEYRVTGVKTFIVSHDGVVYQKDFGPATLQEFIRMERFNPDKSWTPVPITKQ